MKRVLDINRRVLAVLPPDSRRFLIAYGFLTAVLAIVDIVALGIMALVLPGLINASNAPTFPLIGRIDTFPRQAGVILGYVVVVIVKSALNIILIRIATRRFATHEVAIGQRLFSAYMHAPWVDRLGKNTQQIIRAVDSGVAATISGVLMPSMTVFGDAVTVLAVVGVLFSQQPTTAIATVVYLGLVALLLARVISPRAIHNGKMNRDNANRTVLLLMEVISALKEITLKGSVGEVEQAVRNRRVPSAGSRSNQIFLNQVPRFVLEAGLVGGFVVIGAAGYVAGGQTAAVEGIALFALGGFRLVPALTRVQGTLATVQTNAAFAEQVITDINEADHFVAAQELPDTDELPEGLPEIRFENVTYTYPGGSRPALVDVSLTIPAGSTVGVVGSSGAGKSTLVDLLLGLLSPSSGAIRLGEKDMTGVLKAWRRRVGYVPQDVALFDLSVAQNVALTWDPDAVDEDLAREALGKAQLLDFVDGRERGIHGRIGERGLGISGGQRQRIGIARGLYRRPKILVLDEATSALDTLTEAAVTDAIKALGREVTTITIAHRLSTIRDCDIIFFFRDGRMLASGSFAEVVAEVQEFADQAELAGLGQAPSRREQDEAR